MQPRVSLEIQDHKVFARHNKFGTFQVPKEFLNTNQKASAVAAPKAVRQVRLLLHVFPPWHGTTRVALPPVLPLPDFAGAV